MPKTPQALLTIPPTASQALRALGENLAIARTRRRESQRVWAKRLGHAVYGEPLVVGDTLIAATEGKDVTLPADTILRVRMDQPPAVR